MPLKGDDGSLLNVKITGTIQENLRLASEFGSRTSSLNHEELERRMATCYGPHTLSWASPGYVDGS